MSTAALWLDALTKAGKIAPALKGCPFCGEQPQRKPWHGGSPTKERIACVTGETPTEAATRWNSRA